MERGSYAEAARALVRIEAAGAPRPLRRWAQPALRPSAAKAFEPYTKRLPLEPEHPLLRARRLSPATCVTFEAGWWPFGGFLRGCIGVRLRDTEGYPLGYAGRRLESGEHRHGKWKFPPGLPKADLLFNWHRAVHRAQRGLIVVEGPWDAMRLHQAGLRNVVALWGTAAAPSQLRRLGRMPRITLMLDGDAAGRAAATKVAAALRPTPVTIVELSDGRDPANLTDRELCARIAHTTMPPTGNH